MPSHVRSLPTDVFQWKEGLFNAELIVLLGRERLLAIWLFGVWGRCRMADEAMEMNRDGSVSEVDETIVKKLILHS